MPNKSNPSKRKANGAKQLATNTHTSLADVGSYKLQAARQYLGGLSVPSMHRLIKRGLLRPNRKLRHLIFTRAELDRFLNT